MSGLCCGLFVKYLFGGGDDMVDCKVKEWE